MRVEDVSPRTAIFFLGIILLFVAFYLVLIRVDSFIRNNAIDNCALAARFERKDGTGVVSYPIDTFYKSCLQQKSI